MDKAYHIYDALVAKANKERGPPPPPKFKVSLEKWLRMLVHDTNDKKMNVHWMPQDQICHFVRQKPDELFPKLILVRDGLRIHHPRATE